LRCCGIFNENLLQIHCWVCCKKLRPVNIWLSYRQESWLSRALCVPGHCPVERWRNHQISWVMAIVNFYVDFNFNWLIDNYQTGVNRFWLFNWLWLNVDDVRKDFAVKSFFFVATAAYSRELLDKYLLVSELHIAHIIRWVFLDNNFQSLNLACVVVCSCSSWAWQFLEDILHKVGYQRV